MDEDTNALALVLMELVGQKSQTPLFELSHSRARTRAYYIEFILFAVTSVTHPIKHCFPADYMRQQLISTRKMASHPFFRSDLDLILVHHLPPIFPHCGRVVTDVTAIQQ